MFVITTIYNFLIFKRNNKPINVARSIDVISLIQHFKPVPKPKTPKEKPKKPRASTASDANVASVPKPDKPSVSPAQSPRQSNINRVPTPIAVVPAKPSVSPAQSPRKTKPQQEALPTKSNTIPRVNRINLQIPGDTIIEEGLIAEGGFGTVIAISVKSQKTGKITPNLCMKVLKLKNLVDFNNAAREVYLLEKVKHPNIISIMASIRNEKDFTLKIIMEKVTLSLFEYMYMKDIEIDQYTYPNDLYNLQIVKCLKQVAKGIEILHSTNIIHRDLKPQNVVLQLNEFDKSVDVAKIIDFGIATEVHTIVSYTTIITSSDTGVFKGTPPYAAPETKTAKPEYTRACDVYSFGMLIGAMVTRCEPDAKGTRFTRNELMKSGCNPQLADLYEQCVQVKPIDRPEIYYIVEYLNMIYYSH